MISAVKGLTISSGEEVVKKKKSMPAGGLECLSAWGVVYWKEPAEIRDLLRGAARPCPWLLAPILGRSPPSWAAGGGGALCQAKRSFWAVSLTMASHFSLPLPQP